MKVVKKTLERSLFIVTIHCNLVIATHGKCINKSFLLATTWLWLLIEYYNQNPPVTTKMIHLNILSP